MKALLCFALLATSAFAQDPAAYLKNFDAKIYSLKTKGVKDFVVDIESSRLTKQLNDQQIFGKVEEVIFRTYWTAQPERVAIEVMGLPEGFKEVKEDLKASIATMLENLIPPTTQQRFPGYKISKGQGQNEYILQDPTGLAPIPSYTLKFNAQDILEEVVGNRPIGTFSVKPVYTKESFADGKLVLAQQTTTTTEGGGQVSTKKELDYGKVEGIGVLTEVTVTTEQKGPDANAKAVSASETIEFKNYKINHGDALKYFLGNDPKDATEQKKK